jgi:uncharacterized membrane protein YdjX (TVP38/TMEM64 family)
MIDSETKTPPSARSRAIGRTLVLLLIAGGMVLAWLHRAALGPISIEAAIAGYPAAPLVFLAAHVLASLLFVPRTVLAIAAGLLFGIFWGLAWAALGSVLGAVAGFMLARYVNGGLIEPERLRRLGSILRYAEGGGWRTVAALRLIPIIPHSLANYALGLTRLPLGAYALGSLLGQLPMTIAYVSLGAAGGRVAAGQAGWLVPTLVGVAALIVSFFLPRLVRRWL